MGWFGTKTKAAEPGAIKCTYCGGDQWYRGPSGGMSTNILCANEKCRHWFNHTPGLSLDDLKRVEPTEEERTQEEFKKRQELDDHIQAMIEAGASIFREGGALLLCYNDRRIHRYTSITDDDHWRAHGWLEAAALYRDPREGF